MVLLPTIALLFACTSQLVQGATVTIQWQADMNQTAQAQRGDTLRFIHSGTKPITRVATKAEFDACNFSFQKMGPTGRSPSDFTIPATTPNNAILYFGSSRSPQCSDKGIKVAVTVSGGAGGDTGECFAVACRSKNGDKPVAQDPRCCSIHAANGYMASCAPGYKYYQTTMDSDGGACGGGQDASKGTCCVLSGGAVPSTATAYDATVVKSAAATTAGVGKANGATSDLLSNLATALMIVVGSYELA